MMKPWQDIVQPRIDELSTYVKQRIEKRGDTLPCTFLTRSNPVEVFTLFYNITQNYDYNIIEMWFYREIKEIEIFCSGFKINYLGDIHCHVNSFLIYIKWFRCFFHHLNRKYSKISNCNVYELVHSPIVTCYLQPQRHVIISLMVNRWEYIRNHRCKDPNLADIVDILKKDNSLFDTICNVFIQETTTYYISIVEKYFGNNDFIEKSIECFQFEQYIYNVMSLQMHSLFIQFVIDPTFSNVLNSEKYGWQTILESRNTRQLQVLCSFLLLGDENIWLSEHEKYLTRKLPSLSTINDMIDFYEYQNNWSKMYLEPPIRNRFSDVFFKIMRNFCSNNVKVQDMIVLKVNYFMKKHYPVEKCVPIIEFLQFVQDRDHVLSQFKLYLSKRLFIDPRIQSEQQLLDKFHILLGLSFIINMKAMLTEFEFNYLESDSGIIKIFKLSKFVWGFKENIALQYRFPLQLPNQNDDLNKKYQLSMVYGSVVIKAYYEKGITREFIMNPIQSIVLLTMQNFNNFIAYDDIVRILNIPDDNNHNLIGVLMSLSTQSCPLLIHKNNLWCINQHYVPSSSHIIVGSIQKFIKHESSQTSENIHAIEACLVHTMKQHKKLSYNHLIRNVLKTMNLSSSKTVKTCIDSLIHREYISRDPQSMSLLHYEP